MSKSITAIIPAKGISHRLPNKNILPFGESNLLIHKIRQLKQVEDVNTIIVSSEDDAILSMACAEGVVSIKRPIEYAEETKPFNDFLHYIVQEAPDEHIMWACCTSPMVEPELYNQGCEKYHEKLLEGYDSLISVLPYQHYLLDENGPFTFEWGPNHKNSQELKKLYFFTDGIILAPRKKMIEWKYYFGHNPYMMEVDKKSSVDIDDIYDYEFAKTLYKLRKRNI